jgi:predicted nucleotidyltransferase
MSLPELMAGLDLPASFREEIASLLEKKAKSSEVGLGPRRQALDDYISREMAWGRSSPVAPRNDPSVRSEAEALFLSIVKGGG